MKIFDKKLGYYQCSNMEFESKIQAFLYSMQNNQPVSWVFNDDMFSRFDWTIEPPESLDALYDIRSRQLRESYDYLILSYSGGSDSHNILMSFIRQGLHIDEIVVNTLEKGWKPVTTLDPSNTSSYNSGAEHYLQCVPRLKEIQHLIPKTKISIHDLTDYVHESFLKIGDASWVLNKREALNPIGITRYNYLYFDQVKRKFDKEKRIGLILGVEKPKSCIKNNKFYIRFNDRAANMVTIIDHIKDYDNSTIEYFYWSPDCVPLLIKQGHVVKRWLELNPQYQPLWDVKTTDYKTVRTYHEKLLKSVIYSTWNENWFQVDKATKDWYSEFDNWFIDACSNTKSNAIWKEGVEFVKNTLTPFVRLDENNNADGLSIFFKHYEIGNLVNN